MIAVKKKESFYDIYDIEDSKKNDKIAKKKPLAKSFAKVKSVYEEDTSPDEEPKAKKKVKSRDVQ